MHKLIVVTAALATVAVAGCNESPSDKLADRVENAADARADNLQAKADMLNNRAEQVRDTGKARSDAIQAAGQNVQAMSQEQRDAIVANQAAAVR